MTNAYEDEGVTAEASLLEDESFVRGVQAATQVLRRTFFRPNVLFLNMERNNLADMQVLADGTAAYSMAVILLTRHPIMNMGREKHINVWISHQSPEWQFDEHATNLDMMILAAIQLARNWNGRITLCMSIIDPTERLQATTYLENVITLARLPQSTNMVILDGAFYDVLAEAPAADLSIFGLAHDAKLEFTQKIFGLVDASCIFVRDSGVESAFA
ncbi:MAG: hypothetical protein HC804_12830 [Anaerolineae bacterium]|nr:hypothetical protein [Anaerolineae bacterium]